ncbi:MAG TPA: hypothetical protein VIH27_00365, partial [Nitrososphaerales archaeon]
FLAPTNPPKPQDSGKAKQSYINPQQNQEVLRETLIIIMNISKLSRFIEEIEPIYSVETPALVTQI